MKSPVFKLNPFRTYRKSILDSGRVCFNLFLGRLIVEHLSMKDVISCLAALIIAPWLQRMTLRNFYLIFLLSCCPHTYSAFFAKNRKTDLIYPCRQLLRDCPARKTLKRAEQNSFPLMVTHPCSKSIFNRLPKAYLQLIILSDWCLVKFKIWLSI